jgi:hypothetical protein
MRSLKRDVGSSLLFCALALVIAMVWGSPFISRTAHADVQPPQAQMQQQNPQAIAKPHPGTLKRMVPRKAAGY